MEINAESEIELLKNRIQKENKDHLQSGKKRKFSKKLKKDILLFVSQNNLKYSNAAKLLGISLTTVLG